MWVWASIKPGSAYMPLPLMISAPAMSGALLEIESILSPETTIDTGPRGGAPSPLMSMTSLMMRVSNGPSPLTRSRAGAGIGMPALMVFAARSSPGKTSLKSCA